MIALGLAHSPIEFCTKLKQDKVKYSVNELTSHKVAVFVGLESFTILRKRNAPKRILIFDSLDRLKMLENLFLIKNKNPNAAYSTAMSWSKESEDLSIKNHDYVVEFINKNRDVGFLHFYNTNLYNISSTVLRDQIRNVYLSFLNGAFNKSKFDKELASLCPRRGKGLDAVNALIELSNSDVFIRMQKCIQDVKGKPSKEVDVYALKYDVEPFEIRYLLSTLVSK